MEKSEEIGMVTFDKALFKLFRQGLITEADALRNADSPNNLRLRIKLAANDVERKEDFSLESRPGDEEQPS